MQESDILTAMATRRSRKKETTEENHVEESAQVEAAKPEPKAEPEAITGDQMLRIKRASNEELESLLVPGFPEDLAACVRAELEERRAKSKPQQKAEFVRVTEARTRRTRDGFFTDVKEGSLFPLSEEAQLKAEGFKLERVQASVMEDQMGNPRLRLA